MRAHIYEYILFYDRGDYSISQSNSNYCCLLVGYKTLAVDQVVANQKDVFPQKNKPQKNKPPCVIKKIEPPPAFLSTLSQVSIRIFLVGLLNETFP